MMMMKTVPAIALVILATPVAAEISGSGSPNANCGGAELGGRIQHAEDATPIAGIALHLAAEEIVYRAVTGPSGRYLFFNLCEGEYDLSLDYSTVPDGLTLSEGPTGLDEDDEDDDDRSESRTSASSWEVEIDENERLRDVDFRFTGTASSCSLGLQAACSVPSLASELYECSKDVRELSMRWNGARAIRVVAHLGDRNDEVLADLAHVEPGQVVSVGPMSDPPGDVTWEIFEAGSDIKLGESRFHLSCDDEEMDGPEDCGLPQGDGKDNKAERINDWALAGLVDEGGLIDCTALAYAETCTFQPRQADCSTLDKVHWLTFVYGTGDCAGSRHGQPDKFECEGDIDSASPVTVTLEDDTVFTVAPGEAFSIPRDGSDTEIVLANGGGEQFLKIHTSCSKPLAAGDRYGSLLLGAINGLGVVSPVDFRYELTQEGSTPTPVVVTESLATIGPTGLVLEAGDSVTLHGSMAIDTTLSNTITATAGTCATTAMTTVEVAPTSPCEVIEREREFHDKEIRWRLAAATTNTATVERIELSWPYEVAGKLKEMLFDGDKFYDHDLHASAAVLSAADLEGETKKRRIKRADERVLKIKFDKDIEGEPGEYGLRVHFAEGCSISW